MASAPHYRAVSSMNVGMGGGRLVPFLETLTQDGNHGGNDEPVDPLPSEIDVLCSVNG
jgi:hypothetical protein